MGKQRLDQYLAGASRHSAGAPWSCAGGSIRVEPSDEPEVGGDGARLFFPGPIRRGVAVAEQMLQHNPDYHFALRIGAASAALAGRSDVAHRMAGHLQVIDPAFRVSRLREYLGPYQKTEFLEKYAQGLRRRGCPNDRAAPPCRHRVADVAGYSRLMGQSDKERWQSCLLSGVEQTLIAQASFPASEARRVRRPQARQGFARSKPPRPP